MSLFDRYGSVPRPVARLVADHGLHDRSALVGTDGRLVAPGLRRVVVLARDGVVSAPTDPERTADLGVAVANLSRLPRPRHTVLTAGDARVDCFIADDVFGASRLLVLDELLADLLLLERPAHGTLVVVPNRHLLAVHVLRDLSAVPAALSLLGELALVEHRIAEPLSPWVYYRSTAGELSLLSSPTGGGPLTAAFESALHDLAAAGPLTDR